MTLGVPLIVSLSAGASEKVEIGRFHSRAVWTEAKVASSAGAASPVVVILVPGSGPNGPEEMMPPTVTVDQKFHSIFAPISQAFQDGGLSTLALGKPGVEFFSDVDQKYSFYDQALYQSLKWSDLIANLNEAVKFVKGRKPSARIFVLGHSEGTAVAVDYANDHPDVAGLILLGYMGEDMKTTLSWQLYRRSIDEFIAKDVDANHDGFITKTEASNWTEFRWNFKSETDEVSFSEIESALRANADLAKAYATIANAPLYGAGIFARGPIIEKTARLTQDVYVFNGQLDLQTRPEESRRLAEAAVRLGKANLSVNIIPGVGHGFSPPRPPRSHPLLDITVGPVEASFLQTLALAGKHIVAGKKPADFSP